jgi:hypothetical protein
MSPEAKQKIQLALLAGLVVASIRAGIIFYDRHEDKLAAEQQKKARDVGYSNPDLYVSPKKLYPYDLKSAKELTKQPAWIREGYHYTYYPYDSATRKVDFGHSTGLLGPIEKLAITDVVTATAPGAGPKLQVMAVFQKEGKKYAFPIGQADGGDYKIYSDDILFVEDPHDLYKHWPADVWQSVDQHQVKPGMTELQADFAVGLGMPESGGSDLERTIHYPNGGKPLVVVYHGGKATEIKPDAPS